MAPGCDCRPKTPLSEVHHGYWHQQLDRPAGFGTPGFQPWCLPSSRVATVTRIIPAVVPREYSEAAASIVVSQKEPRARLECPAWLPSCHPSPFPLSQTPMTSSYNHKALLIALLSKMDVRPAKPTELWFRKPLGIPYKRVVCEP